MLDSVTTKRLSEIKIIPGMWIHFSEFKMLSLQMFKANHTVLNVITVHKPSAMLKGFMTWEKSSSYSAWNVVFLKVSKLRNPTRVSKLL